uniref:Protein MTO1 homolog, mitochondrial n=1 Tax=Meloidogyne hapla TaxID=6305 RepID=A0A1I8B2G0_MELHA
MFEEPLASLICPSNTKAMANIMMVVEIIFLEPEGLDSDLVYPQGCALGFDLDVQVKIMRAVEGLENVEVTQPGYSVRYNFVHPQQLFPTLETQKVCGLFLAGQINGTTGYEEAAAQGLIAGANAAERAKAYNKRDEKVYNPLTISRTEGYIGVMIDDLTNYGVTEAYRIFTSRSENRLELRPDNADLRLTKMAYEAGMVSEHRWSCFKQMCSRLDLLDERLDSLRFTSDGWNAKIEGLNTTGKTCQVYSAKKLLLKHPELRIERLATIWPFFNEFIGERLLLERIINKQRYSHLHKELKERIEKLEKEMHLEIPQNLNYLEQGEFKAEVRERLNEAKPKTLAAAARVPGVTDTVLFTLLRYARNTLNTNNVQ